VGIRENANDVEIMDPMHIFWLSYTWNDDVMTLGWTRGWVGDLNGATAGPKEKKQPHLHHQSEPAILKDTDLVFEFIARTVAPELLYTMHCRRRP
jgi:hypothetical protein